jgi:hypothetical protein
MNQQHSETLLQVSGKERAQPKRQTFAVKFKPSVRPLSLNNWFKNKHGTKKIV